jgi:hypothetical protein
MNNNAGFAFKRLIEEQGFKKMNLIVLAVLRREKNARNSQINKYKINYISGNGSQHYAFIHARDENKALEEFNKFIASHDDKVINIEQEV